MEGLFWRLWFAVTESYCVVLTHVSVVSDSPILVSGLIQSSKIIIQLNQLLS